MPQTVWRSWNRLPAASGSGLGHSDPADTEKTRGARPLEDERDHIVSVIRELGVEVDGHVIRVAPPIELRSIGSIVREGRHGEGETSKTKPKTLQGMRAAPRRPFPCSCCRIKNTD